MISNRFSILVMTNYYLPGYKGGGSLRTLVNMVNQLSAEFNFKIMTADRDLGDIHSYPGVEVDSWQQIGKEQIFYTSLKNYSLPGFNRLISKEEYDVLYLNGFFSPRFTIRPLILRRMGFVTNKPIIIAPKGELSAGALVIKNFKKRLFLILAKVLGLYRNVIWQASSQYEADDIRHQFGNKVKIFIAPDLPPLIDPIIKPACHRKKTPGNLRVVFLARITQIKNLTGALMMLDGLKGEVEFNIYGPIEDKKYWKDCRDIIRKLANNIKVEYRGTVAHEKVFETMSQYDLFFLPSLGENFNNTILEAFVSGCPVLISDKTPWRDLADKGVGWDLPLSNSESFRNRLQHCIEMDAPAFEAFSQRAREFGIQYCQDKDLIELNRKIFWEAINPRIPEKVSDELLK